MHLNPFTNETYTVAGTNAHEQEGQIYIRTTIDKNEYFITAVGRLTDAGTYQSSHEDVIYQSFQVVVTGTVSGLYGDTDTNFGDLPGGGEI